MKGLEDEQTRKLIQQMGGMLRKIRSEQKLSLEELAEKTGVSKLTLGKIERGETNPTLGVVWKITEGLSIPLTRILVMDDHVDFSRCGEGFMIYGPDKKWSVETVFRNTDGPTMEIYRAFLQPHATYSPEPHHEGAIEFVTVMSGNISFQVEETVYDLKQFDSIKFEAASKHRYKNTGDDEAVLHVVVRYPS
jgi:XRE family transcriptional regulator, regulator of sulfur utilization